MADYLQSSARFGATVTSVGTRIAAALAVIATLLVSTAPRAQAQQGTVVVNEIVADNASVVDNFGATPDWIELRNAGNAAVNLNDWTLADNSASFELPAINLAPGDRLLIWASDRNLAGPPTHTNFRLSASGETVRLARPDGTLADEVTYLPLAEDQAWGRSQSNVEGYLAEPTPGTANSALAPSVVTFSAPPQVFTGSITVALAGNVGPGQTLRYSVDGSPVSATSPTYSAPLSLTNSTVVRAAVVDGSVVGPERSAGYIRIADNLANRTSDLPIVLVQSSGPVSTTDTNAIVSVINRGVDGRASVIGEADYTGFAGLRIRGDSSATFPKKQFKFELWDNPSGESRNANLLGLGSDDDWGLYAPGRLDRAMIQNPFVYELGHRIGVAAPDYQFVELWIEDEVGSAIGAGDYQGLYLLRETIEIDDGRVDITKHTSSSSGPSGGYIVRQDRDDECCTVIDDYVDTSNGSASVVEPGASEITADQLSYIDGWWDEMKAAAQSRDINRINQYFEIDAFIDYWLVSIVSNDPDAWRLSTHFYKEPGGGLVGGPLWDFDRTLGSADSRNDEISEATGWGWVQPDFTDYRNLLIDFLWVDDLWKTPAVQARLRARWAELRAGAFSDAEINAIITDLRDEILESYDRELTVWNSPDYGPRFGNGLVGEVDFMRSFVQTRLDWIDGQLLTNESPPTVTNPGLQIIDENVAVSLQIEASGSNSLFFDATGLPDALTIDDNGLITGTVAYGDATTFPVQLTVTRPSGAATTINFVIEVRPAFNGSAKVVLNEYNAVGPGVLLDNGGADAGFGAVPGNAGDWFELVTIEDDLDMTGWTFELWSNNESGVVAKTAELVLGNDSALTGLRSGSIITVAESIADNLSYAPRNDDWTLNLQANGAGAGSLFETQVDFDTNNSKWRLVIRDATDTIVAPIAGETEPWDDANGGVSSREVFALNADPTGAVSPTLDYADTVQSTFGLPNRLVSPGGVDGGVQDLAALRPALAPDGDVNCDGQLNIVDAYDVARFSVALVDDSNGCPLTSADTIHAAAGDLSGDGTTNVLDASVIARCVVGLPDPVCP